MSKLKLDRHIVMLAAMCGLAAGAADQPQPLAQMQGIDFAEGAQAMFGASFYGRQGVNYVYAQPNGTAAKMTAIFTVAEVPSSPMCLWLEAMDDDYPGYCRVEISLNGQTLHSGPSGYPDASWLVRRFQIATGGLKSGTNELRILNLHEKGGVGVPPWFMVARAAVAGEAFQLPRPNSNWELHVDLPAEARPIPEPLSVGQDRPGFKFRGTKGWFWTPEQYLSEIPVLVQYKMNFLMNCYSSMFSSAPGQPWTNEWWKPLPETKKAAYAKVFRACRDQGIIFCFAVHPQLASPRPLDPAKAEDIEQFFQNYDWAQSEGVKWFSVSLDDVSWGQKGPGFGGKEHARLVNTIFGRLRAKDPETQLIFCPVPYWGDGTTPDHRAYLEELGRDMQPDVYVFWTGDSVVTPRITRKAAASYKAIVAHRLFLWDNYPVNDNAVTLHLGPVIGRDADLCEVVDGYMGNPLCPQNEANRIPLLTCADYAFNPKAYDPQRSIAQAILHLTQTVPQRTALKDLVEAYPGMLRFGGSTSSNPVRQRFTELLNSETTRTEAEQSLRQMEDLAKRLEVAFPNQFGDARKTLEENLTTMREELARKRR